MSTKPNSAVPAAPATGIDLVALQKQMQELIEQNQRLQAQVQASTTVNPIDQFGRWTSHRLEFSPSEPGTDRKGVSTLWAGKVKVYAAGLSTKTRPLEISSYSAAAVLALWDNGLKERLQELANGHDTYLAEREAVNKAMPARGAAKKS